MASELSLASLPEHRGRARAQRMVLGWLIVGFASYALLPWYFPQNLTLLRSMAGIFGGTDGERAGAGGGARQAVAVGRAGRVGGRPRRLAPAGRTRAGLDAGRRRRVGLAGLLIGGFTIGARGWSFEVLNGLFGELASGQFGVGLGGALALLSLLMLLGAGIAGSATSVATSSSPGPWCSAARCCCSSLRCRWARA